MCANEEQVPRQIGRCIRCKDSSYSTISYQAKLSRIAEDLKTNTLLSLRRVTPSSGNHITLLNCLCFEATFIVHNFVYSAKPCKGNLGEKSVHVHMAVLAGVSFPLKITLQCSAEKSLGTIAVHNKSATFADLCLSNEILSQQRIRH